MTLLNRYNMKKIQASSQNYSQGVFKKQKINLFLFKRMLNQWFFGKRMILAFHTNRF